MNYDTIRLLKQLPRQTTVDVKFAPGFQDKLADCPDTLWQLHCAGLATCDVKLNTSLLTKSLRSKLVRSLTRGIYLGGFGRGHVIYEHLTAKYSLPASSLSRCGYGWYLNTYNVPKTVIKALADHEYADSVALAMERGTNVPERTNIANQAAKTYWSFHSKAKRSSVESIERLFTSMADSPDYKEKAAPAIKLLKEGGSIELV